MRAAGDAEHGAGARVDFVHGGAQRVVDAQAVVGGGDFATFWPRALLPVMVTPCWSPSRVPPLVSSEAWLTSAAVAVVLKVAADAAPGGFAPSRTALALAVFCTRSGSGCLRRSGRTALGVDRRLGCDIAAGFQRQFALAAQFAAFRLSLSLLSNRRCAGWKCDCAGSRVRWTYPSPPARRGARRVPL